MDLMAAIGLLSSIVTLEEAGRSWVLIVKDKLKTINEQVRDFA